MVTQPHNCYHSQCIISHRAGQFYISKLNPHLSNGTAVRAEYQTKPSQICDGSRTLTCHTSCRGTLPPGRPGLWLLQTRRSCVRCCRCVVWRWCWEAEAEGGGWPGTAAGRSFYHPALSGPGQLQPAQKYMFELFIYVHTDNKQARDVNIVNTVTYSVVTLSYMCVQLTIRLVHTTKLFRQHNNIQSSPQGCSPEATSLPQCMTANDSRWHTNSYFLFASIKTNKPYQNTTQK